MKLAELDLDTIYADIDGRPMMVLSLDKLALTGRYGGKRIRPVGPGDKSSGVATIRHTHIHRDINLDDLVATARRLRDDMPERSTMVGNYLVEVSVTRAIARTWEDHQIQLHMQQERAAAAAVAAERAREARARNIARIQAALPEGVQMSNLSPFSDTATLRLSALADLLEASAPVEVTEGVAFTPREMSLLAAGFDAAIATMKYEDGSPVEIVAMKNPYRIEER